MKKKMDVTNMVVR